ncbi:MAG: zinc metallopeptidase [Bacilli bacterium]|nr:zinc metallopeptidase [Mycoplasmatota bacterium]MDD6264280.1 zinc metallopeptidase [bacterium]MDY2697320.1 zinc metallopeptidase [Bacilli bacterium]MDD6941555.1 zinc metallopeptidase [bacterium]MDY5993369.1 zinc metallopeptidase [Bacilli bacterium]
MQGILLVLSLLVTSAAQIYINSSYSKTKRIKNRAGITGAQTARKILDENGLSNVKVEEVSGILGDHYDPRTKTVRLSSDIYRNTSIASASVAAHECGHAIQDKEGYFFLKLRNSIVPLVNFASYAGYFAILIGIIASSLKIIWIGIIAEIVILVFQLITLPVEFAASKRALKQLEKQKILEKIEISTSKKMLTAAALTYVASVTATILEILRLLIAVGGRND